MNISYAYVYIFLPDLFLFVRGCVHSINSLDIALDIIKKCPHLPAFLEMDGLTPLAALAQSPALLQRGLCPLWLCAICSREYRFSALFSFFKPINIQR